MDQKFEVARTGEGWDALQAAMVRGAREGWLSYVNPPPSLENLRWNWDHILSYDPAPALEALNCPVLVLYGGLDTIVPARVHRDRMQAALERARTRDVTIKVFDKANHAFLQAVTGGRRERRRPQGLRRRLPGHARRLAVGAAVGTPTPNARRQGLGALPAPFGLAFGV